ncbi:LuxR C-terminal-related transcriptional regulator [Streptomyces sp. NPDC005811]|uniref:ATP-binding protein n=1 Tax=Streptomyces sp. NPDC005811 TaxID=3154565 RepID=UPI0033D86A25
MTVTTSVMADAGNMPAALTSFVGRGRELAEVRRMLDKTRLLTLTGVGGVGKTRLALEAARACGRGFADGVWVVDLAAVREPSAVARAVVTAVGGPDLGARPVLQDLAAYMARRQVLIVLDNCEHLLDACTELVRTLLRAAAELRIMATSRQTLGVTGEHVFTVHPLSPDEAVELLHDRAAAVRPDFQVSDANRAQVSRLCAELEWLPLAIELATSRLRTLTVEQTTDRLKDRFALLTSGCRSALPRQRTLRAMVDWSWDLCSPAERLLWNRLSVFAGSFCLDAAETVCTGEGIATHEVLDLLDQLVAQSVVVLTTEAAGPPRYRLLETIRQYGRERLVESGEQETLLRRHHDYFLAVAAGAGKAWPCHGQGETAGRLRAEHANLLAALDYDADPQARLALAAALTSHWVVDGYVGEGRRQLDRALAAAPEPTSVRGQALCAAAWVAQTQGDLVAADRWLDEADIVGEQVGDPMVRARVWGGRGVSAHYRGQLEESMSRYEEARARLVALGDEAGAAVWLLALACAQTCAGDPRAAETGRQVVAAAETSGDRWGYAQLLLSLGYKAWERDDGQEAEALARAALDKIRTFRDYTKTAAMLELLAWTTARRGGHGRAAWLMGAVDALCRDAGTAITAFPQIAGHREHCHTEVMGALGPAEYAKALAEGGRCNSLASVIAFALETATESDQATQAAAVCPLTRRERDVAALVADGMTNRQTATRLGLSTRTVDGHVQRILAKLGVECRSQIATWWVMNWEDEPERQPVEGRPGGTGRRPNGQGSSAVEHAA